jgi:F-type H+-transporting ATPase subunit epsilon
MNTFYLRVVSSDKVFFEDKVTRFVLPLEDGEMGILAHHENMVIATSIDKNHHSRWQDSYRCSW